MRRVLPLAIALSLNACAHLGFLSPRPAVDHGAAATRASVAVSLAAGEGVLAIRDDVPPETLARAAGRLPSSVDDEALDARLALTRAALDVFAHEGRGTDERPQRTLEAAGGPGDARRMIAGRGPEERTLEVVGGAAVERTAYVMPPQQLAPAAVEIWQHPVESPRVTSRFGPRIDPITGQPGRMHRGMDFGAPTGTTVYAPASGRVVLAGWCDRGTGNCVVIDHEGGWRSQYFHLSRVTTRAGAHIAQGESLGEIGSTGRSTGPHLHWQVGRDGVAVDPEPMLGQPVR